MGTAIEILAENRIAAGDLEDLCGRGSPLSLEDGWSVSAERLFAARAREGNRAIARHNLLAPSARWHIPFTDIGHDLTRLVPTDERRRRRASAAPSPFDSFAAPGI
jgi:hypothetical protein